MYLSNLSSGNLSYGIGGTATRSAKTRAPLQANKLLGNLILNGLSVEEFERLSPFLESVKLVGDGYIYKPEDNIRYVYFPETAVISQFHVLEDGRTMETAMIGKDGATGCAALFGAPLANCFSQISVAGNAFRMNVEILKQEFLRGGALQKLLLEYAARYAAQISCAVVCSNYHSVEQRFCTWLLMLCDRRGADTINLTHSQIAAYLGVHRPSFTHIASTLREKQIIDYMRGQLKISDRRALINRACCCYAPIA